jgi:hypothetical protein
VFLVDEVVSRRERRRWQALSRHAAHEMANAAMSARIAVSNVFHAHPATRAAQEQAVQRTGARRAAGEAPDDLYETELRPLLLPLLAGLRDDPEWRMTVLKNLRAASATADSVLARWSVVSIGEDQLAAPTDALVAVVRRLSAVTWCLRMIATASEYGWADRRHDRYRIAQDALPELMLMLHRDAMVAYRTCARVLKGYGVPRLMDDQIAQELGLPGRSPGGD